MKILMLVNWKVAYENQIPEGKQPPDYVVPGQKYWFFRYLSDDISVHFHGWNALKKKKSGFISGRH